MIILKWTLMQEKDKPFLLSCNPAKKLYQFAFLPTGHNCFISITWVVLVLYIAASLSRWKHFLTDALICTFKLLVKSKNFSYFRYLFIIFYELPVYVFLLFSPKGVVFIFIHYSNNILRSLTIYQAVQNIFPGLSFGVHLHLWWFGALEELARISMYSIWIFNVFQHLDKLEVQLARS